MKLKKTFCKQILRINFINILLSVLICQSYSQSHIPFLKNNRKYTVYDLNTNSLKSDLNFESLTEFKYGLAKFKLNGKYGIINSKHEVILQPEYDIIGELSDDLIFVGKGEYSDKFQTLFSGEGGFVNKKGEFQISLSDNILDAGVFFNNVNWFKNKDGKHGILDRNGNTIVECIYDYIADINNGKYIVTKNNKYGVINNRGKILLPIKYEWLFSSSENLYTVQLNNKWGFVDSLNQIKIPLKYNWAGSFSNGLAPVKLNDKWGYINKVGSVVIPFKYDYAGSFTEGLASVSIKDKYGCINSKGDVTVPFIYNHIFIKNKQVAIVDIVENPNDTPGPYYDGIYGIINPSNGNILVPLKFDMIEFIQDDIFKFSYKQVRWFSNIKTKVNYTDISGVQNIFINYCPDNFIEIKKASISGTARKYTAKDGHKYYEVKLMINPSPITKKYTAKIIASRLRQYTTETRYLVEFGKIGGENAIDKIEYSIKSSNGTIIIMGCIESDVFQVEGVYSCETGRFKGPSATIYFRDLKIIQ